MRLALSFILISSLSTVAQAEGAYVEGGTFTRHYNLSVPNATAAGDSATGYAVAPALRLGYEIDERWAVEAGYFNHGSPAYSYSLAGADGRLTSGGYSWVMAGRMTLPLNDRFALVGRLGLASNHSSLSGTGVAANSAVSGSTTALYGGLGLETKLSPNWHLGVGWEGLGMNRDKGGSVINGLSTTLRYKF